MSRLSDAVTVTRRMPSAIEQPDGLGTGGLGHTLYSSCSSCSLGPAESIENVESIKNNWATLLDTPGKMFILL